MSASTIEERDASSAVDRMLLSVLGNFFGAPFHNQQRERRTRRGDDSPLASIFEDAIQPLIDLFDD